MNNRSMGLDSECDVTIDVALPANRDAAPAITRLRESLIAEHLGVETARSEEHTSELQSLMRISYAVFCLKKKKANTQKRTTDRSHQTKKTYKHNQTTQT